MAESINNIVQVNTILTAAGLQYANFVSIRAIAETSMLNAGVTFDVDTYKTYGDFAEVALDFNTSSPVYQQAAYWFGSTPKPDADSFQVWMRDDVGDADIIETLTKAEDQAPWKYFIALPAVEYQTDEATCLALALWADANQHIIPLVFSDASALDENTATDIPSVLRDNGARYITQKFRSQSIVDTAASQKYAMFAEMAFFQRFNFDGIRTSVDPEFKPLANTIGEDLYSSQYTALQGKLLGYYTNLDLKGEEVRSRVRYSWTTSSYGETVDDVFSIDVLVNRIQVDSFNYLSKRKRGLRDPQDYGGLLDTIEDAVRQANLNGTLATDAVIEDPRTGEEVVLKNGYLMLSEPLDVQNLTPANIAAREYPAVQIIVVLARSARQVTVNLYVE